jgi:hypothetical protein
MNSFPVNPTIFGASRYDPTWDELDYFRSPDGTGSFPDHHCKKTWLLSKPYIQKTRNAVDIGCRVGEYSRYLSRDFDHIYAFDHKGAKKFNINVDTKNVTHFNVFLGDGSNTKRVGVEREIGTMFYRLDDFNLKDIDYIKIDVDGYERSVINGAINTITTCWPLIVLEVCFETETLEFCLKELGYTHVATCPRGFDHILIKGHI